MAIELSSTFKAKLLDKLGLTILFYTGGFLSSKCVAESVVKEQEEGRTALVRRVNSGHKNYKQLQNHKMITLLHSNNSLTLWQAEQNAFSQ